MEEEGRKQAPGMEADIIQLQSSDVNLAVLLVQITFLVGR